MTPDRILWWVLAARVSDAVFDWVTGLQRRGQSTRPVLRLVASRSPASGVARPLKVAGPLELMGLTPSFLIAGRSLDAVVPTVAGPLELMGLKPSLPRARREADSVVPADREMSSPATVEWFVAMVNRGQQ